MPQFKLYNVYKDDSKTGLDVVDNWNEIGPVQYKILEKHSIILRAIYSFCTKMLYKNITNPLPAIGGLYFMYELQDNPTYPKLKYTKGYIGVCYMLCWVEILERNKEVFQYVVKDNCPIVVKGFCNYSVLIYQHLYMCFMHNFYSSTHLLPLYTL